jgi:ribosomal subunit interface protein
MQVPMQIVFHDLARSDAIEAEIRQKAEKLEQFHEHITRCRVTVETIAKHQHQGRRYNVHIDLTVPAGEVIVARDHSNEDAYVAIRDAFDSAKRQLEDLLQRQRGHVKSHG